VPIVSYYYQEATAQHYLSLLNVSTIEEARQIDSSAVIRANVLQVAAAPYGTFVYNPVADGIFAPLTPGQLLNAGQFVKDVQVMVGHNVNEGDSFTPPYAQNQQQTQAWVRVSYPGAPQPALDYLTDVLYPPVYDGSEGYTNGIRRAIKITTEGSFTCNTNFINRAYGNQTYAYEFQVPPALHGQDVAYTYYNGQGTNLTGLPLFAPVAEVLQGYLTNFVKTGNPNGANLPYFPMQGNNASMNGLNVSGTTTETDPTVNERCTWLQKALLL
jgi:carboxylesterase type B